jgi:hypothetical protein
MNPKPGEVWLADLVLKKNFSLECPYDIWHIYKRTRTITTRIVYKKGLKTLTTRFGDNKGLKPITTSIQSIRGLQFFFKKL